MQSDEAEAVVSWCLAACRESRTPRATFDELMEIVASSPNLSVEDLDSIRRLFIRRIVASSVDREFAVRRRPSEGEFLASRRAMAYFRPCFDRCRRSDNPFEMLSLAIAALARAPDWTDDDLHELRMRVTKAILDDKLGLTNDPLC